MSYHLKLSPTLQQLHLVFHIVKLTTASKDPISGRHSEPPSNPIIADREKEWEMEKILDSHWHCKKY